VAAGLSDSECAAVADRAFPLSAAPSSLEPSLTDHVVRRLVVRRLVASTYWVLCFVAACWEPFAGVERVDSRLSWLKQYDQLFIVIGAAAAISRATEKRRKEVFLAAWAPLILAGYGFLSIRWSIDRQLSIVGMQRVIVGLVFGIGIVCTYTIEECVDRIAIGLFLITAGSLAAVFFVKDAAIDDATSWIGIYSDRNTAAIHCGMSLPIYFAFCCKKSGRARPWRLLGGVVATTLSIVFLSGTKSKTTLFLLPVFAVVFGLVLVIRSKRGLFQFRMRTNVLLSFVLAMVFATAIVLMNHTGKNVLDRA
jgi:hypothetical protein